MNCMHDFHSTLAHSNAKITIHCIVQFYPLGVALVIRWAPLVHNVSVLVDALCPLCLLWLCVAFVAKKKKKKEKKAGPLSHQHVTYLVLVRC